MALIKLSLGFDEIKGKMGGVIFSSYRGATMVRNRKAGGGVVSERWREKQQFLVRITSSWSTLTTIEQAAWEAAAPSFPYIDKFGNPQIPSGYQLFVTLNFFNISQGNPIVTTPPLPAVKINYGPITVDVPDISSINVSWSGTTSPGVVIAIAAAPPVSKGVTRVPTRLRNIKTVLSTVAQPVNVAQDFENAWGSMPSDARFWIQTFATDLTTFEKYNIISDFDDL